MHIPCGQVAARAALSAILLAAAGAAAAEHEHESRLEIFGGYSWKSSQEYVLGALPPTPERERRSIHGFDGAAGVAVARRVKLLGEVSGHFGGGHVSVSDFDFLAGPQVELPGFSRFTPFAHALAGSGLSIRKARGHEESEREFAPALALGGGFDYSLSPHLAWRVIQVDYNPTFTKRPGGGRTRQDDVEISLGIVLRR